jgi:hypothetical protein
LVRESEWSREYQVAPSVYSWESKFLTEGLKVTATSIQQRWPSLSPNERLDFAQAFIAKRQFSGEDEEILAFLMEEGPEWLWVTIAPGLVKFSDRDRALSFLLARIRSAHAESANYYCVLELMGDQRAIPLLRERYEEYRHRLPPLEKQALWGELSDYLYCCRALWKLEGLPEYEEALKDLLLHPEEQIRRTARALLGPLEP